MNRNEEFNFTVVNEEGKEVICDIISLLKDESNDELFVVYTDYTLNDNNQFNTYLSQLIEKKGEYSLKSISNKDKYNYLFDNAKAVYGKALNELMENV